MFYDVKVYVFVLVAVLAIASCVPTDSVNDSPVLENSCVKQCPISYEYKPSCGTDKYSYSSNSFYLCFENCGIDIKKDHDGFCNQRPKRSPIPDVETCMSRCPVTADYSPFCGSDNETYPTKGMLTCFNRCGINVIAVSDGKCKLPSATENACVKQCPITDDLSPFCGSDNNEYPTKSYLNCFKSCDLNIRKLNDGPCQKELFVQL